MSISGMKGVRHSMSLDYSAQMFQVHHHNKCQPPRLTGDQFLPTVSPLTEVQRL